MKILAIGGSNSQKSIDRSLAYFVADLFANAIVSKVDISQLNIALYSVDVENAQWVFQMPSILSLNKLTIRI